MATYKSTYNGVTIALIVTESSVDKTANTSTLSWRLVGWLESGAAWYSMSYHAITVNIAGSTVYSLAKETEKVISIGTGTSSSNPVTIASGTKKVTHNSDGTKSCACSYSMAYRWTGGGTWSASGTLALTAIPMEATFTTSGSTTMGSVMKFAITKNGASTVKLYYKINGTEYGIATVSGTSYSWTIPADTIGKLIPTRTSVSTVLICRSYNSSGTKIGSDKTKTVTLIVPNKVPAIGSVTVSPYSDNSTVNGWGLYVAGYSKAKVKVSASAYYGATISKYEVSYNGSVSSTSNTLYSKILTGSSATLTIKVTDSRGRTASTRYDISTIYRYSIPVIKNVVCMRTDSNGNAADGGNCIKLSATSVYSSVGSKNTAKIQYTVKTKSGTTKFSGTLTSGSAIILTGVDITTSYTVTISIMDSLGSNSYSYNIPTEHIAFNLFPSKKGGASFGKYCEKEETLDIGDWTLIAGYGQFGKNVTVRGVIEINDGTSYYGYINRHTIGTTSTTGLGQVVVGNDIASGKAGNARGRIAIYGTNTGYTALYTRNNGTSNNTLYLPSIDGGVLPGILYEAASGSNSASIANITDGSVILGATNSQAASIKFVAILSSSGNLRYIYKSGSASPTVSGRTVSIPAAGGTAWMVAFIR